MTASALIPSQPHATTAWDLFPKLLPAQLLNDLEPKAPQAASTPGWSPGCSSSSASTATPASDRRDARPTDSSA